MQQVYEAAMRVFTIGEVCYRYPSEYHEALEVVWYPQGVHPEKPHISTGFDRTEFAKAGKDFVRLVEARLRYAVRRFQQGELDEYENPPRKSQAYDMADEVKKAVYAARGLLGSLRNTMGIPSDLRLYVHPVVLPWLQQSLDYDHRAVTFCHVPVLTGWAHADKDRGWELGAVLDKR
jgi:hypothetical protein